MWINRGIYVVHLIASETTVFDGSWNLSGVYIKMMRYAHELCTRNVISLALEKVSNIPQDEPEKGKSYYFKSWTLPEKLSLIQSTKYLIVNASAVYPAREAISSGSIL